MRRLVCLVLSAVVLAPMMVLACSGSSSTGSSSVVSSSGSSSGASSSSSGGTSSSSGSGASSSGGGGSGTSSSSGGASSSGSSSGVNSSSSGSSGAAPTGFYVPNGCPYGVTPDTSWGYTALSLDDPSGTTDAPVRVRLGMGGGTTFGGSDYPDPTTRGAFTWETSTANAVAELKIGTSASSLTQTQTGYTWTTSGSGGTAYMHEVHICGLQPATTYYYQVGGGAGAGTWSATQAFTTVATSGTLTFGFGGDSRDTPANLQLVQLRMKNAGVDFQVYSGDFIDTGTDQAEWAASFNAMWQDGTSFVTLGQQLIAATAGNHEDDSTQYFAAWAAPGSGSYAKTYYSFNAGNAHFTVLDDEQLSGGSPQTTEAAAQLAWVKQDLAAANANRSNYPFLVFINHRGMYSTSTHATDTDVLYVRSQLQPLFDQYGVDVALQGHDHDYERSYPLIGGVNASCTAPCASVTQGMGTTYIINGGAGSDAYASGQYSETYEVVGKSFGTGTSWVGCYGVATMSGSTLMLKSYGLTSSGTTVADDTLWDTVTITAK
jgi:hypothetical protein